MKVYDRTENGTTVQVSVKEGLAELNHAMMGGRREVRTMSQINRTDYAVEYKDGRSVRLVQVDAPEPAEAATEEHWTVASHRILLHRFTEPSADGRAVCNKSFRPWRYGNGYVFKTRAEYASSKYVDLYTFCPRCLAKTDD